MNDTQSQPMLALKDAQNKPKVTANLLPCRINHDGPIDPVDTFWNPTEESTQI